MKNTRAKAFFLNLLIHRQRKRPESRRLVVRLHSFTAASAVPVAIHFSGRKRHCEGGVP